MTLAVVSGGLDSVVMAHYLAQTVPIVLLSFDYGQRHARRELACARACAERLGTDYRMLNLTEIGRLLTGSALTDTSVPVPDGHYAEESMRSTIVPNRNAIMLSVAFGLAQAEGQRVVAYAAHAGDHFIYPDCKPAFIEAFGCMEHLATEGAVTLLAPFQSWSKTQIVKVGAELRVPFAETWSCYRGATLHCGTCGTCVERREAFQLAQVVDPTTYMET